MREALNSIGQEVIDAHEETFILFAGDLPSQDLGMVDGKAETLELAVNGVEFIIRQSPSGLRAQRDAGTTGAVLWKVTLLFAEWLSSPTNSLFTQQLLHANSTVVELGCGISGLTALTLAPRVGKYILTDQDYVMKILRQNITENQSKIWPNPRVQRRRNKQMKSASSSRNDTENTMQTNVDILSLDWETNIVEDFSDLVQSGSAVPNRSGADRLDGADVVVACDCIYNEHLVEPFVRTCAKLCELRSHSSPAPTLCIIAQQLRSAEIFELWLASAMERFHLWRISDAHLSPQLAERSGFVIHIGILKR